LIDISEIWSNLVYLVAPFTTLYLLFAASRIQRRWLRLVAVGLSFGSTILVAVASVFMGYLFFGATVRSPATISPDGKHVAIAYWTHVIFDENYVALAHISVRSRYSLVAKEVFTCQVISSSESGLRNDPEVRWLDSRRLLISNKKSSLARCPSESLKVDGIEVLCQE